MNEEPRTRPFRILALDGGGVRGAYSAAVLATLEEATGKRVLEHFDLITGTSTGGIIALGLGMGFPAERILEFYRKESDAIFQASGASGRSVSGPVRHLLGPKHDARPLKTALGLAFGTRRLSDARCRLAIPAYDVTEGRIFVFKTYHHEHLRFDEDLTVVDVALATSAAPSFFSAATIRRTGSVRYIDGGVWANSPVLVGLTEAVHFLGINLGDIDILNIGTTSSPFVVSPRRSGGGLLLWGPAFLELMMTAQAQAAQAQAALLTQGGVFRINQVTARGRFRLDRAGDVPELIELGRSDAVKREVLQQVKRRFLDERKVEPFPPGPR